MTQRPLSVLVSIVFLLAAAGTGAQVPPAFLGGDAPPGTAGPEAGEVAPGVASEAERLRLAISNADYPVTPGDVYRLTFLSGNEQVSSEVLVESDYTLNLGVFGKVNAEGQTVSGLKPRIERIIENAYPRSLPSLTITSIGLFEVTVRGALPRSTRVRAWGLSRLSDVLAGILAPYSSVRNVTVLRQDGTSESYDLFKALFLGEAEQDPYIRPGDSIRINRSQRVVEVQGEVRRPGTYELRPRETFGDLREFFRGFTPRSDPARVDLERHAGALSERVTVDFSPGAEEVSLRDGDVLTVPSKRAVERVVFVEGAVTTALPTPPADATGAAVGGGAAGGLAATPGAPRVAAAGAPRAATGDAPVYNKIAVPVGDRATAHSVLKRVESSISPFADLEDARIYRPSTQEMMPLDATRILYDYDPEEDIPLEALDRIILPIRQPSVIVGGSVPSPGRYPYNPSETYHYYLNLAGRGVDTYGGLGTSIQIYGVDGTPKGTESFIEPGDTINVVAEDMFVLVAGAVNLPGRIPLVPGQDAYYYIRQAGGFNRELNEGKQFFLYDAQGQMRERGATPQPGDTIQASRNSFVYKFNRYFPVISSGLTFATALVTFLTILNAP